jgi:hypothetical protein
VSSYICPHGDVEMGSGDFPADIADSNVPRIEAEKVKVPVIE